MSFGKSFLVAVLLLAASTSANAVLVYTTSTITYIDSNTTFGDGDVDFVMSTPVSDCVGFWFKKSDGGYNSNLSMLLAAFQTKSSVLVYGDNDISQKWTGSSSKFCHLNMIRMQ